MNVYVRPPIGGFCVYSELSVIFLLEKNVYNNDRRLHSHKTFVWSSPPSVIIGCILFRNSKYNMKPKENVPLALFTTMRVGGSARYFFDVSTIEELCEALSFAKDNKLPFFILGKGSNVIVLDEGYDGVVIKIGIVGTKYEDCGEKKRVIVGAGERLDLLIEETVKRGLYGLENLSFIPGTVGATPVQNTGSYGVEAKDVIEWVEAINVDTFKIKKFSNKECHFGYRESFFKTQKGKKYIVVRVSFMLNTKGILNTQYRDVTEYISNHNIKEVTLPILREIIIAIRTKKFSGGQKGTAGSFFKNPTVSKEKLKELLKSYPDLKYFPNGTDKFKIPAAWLLDHVGGWKGFREGNVGAWTNQPLFIVNYGGGSAREIIALSERIIEDIKKKTGIVLKQEVQYLK